MTLVLQERRGPLQTVGESLGRALSPISHPHLRAPFPRERVFLRFLKQWILQFWAGTPLEHNDNILRENRSGRWEKIDLVSKVFFQFADQANDISWVKVAAGRGCSVPGKVPDRFAGERSASVRFFLNVKGP